MKRTDGTQPAPRIHPVSASTCCFWDALELLLTWTLSEYMQKSLLLHAHRDLGMAEAPGPVLMEDVGFRASAGSTGLVPRTSQGVTGAHSDTSAQCLAPRGAQWLQCYHHSGSWLIRSPQQHPGMGGPAGCLSNTHSIRPLQPCPQDLGSHMVGRCWRPPRGS